MTTGRHLAILIAVGVAVRLLIAVTLGLGNDEAYHFLYTRHPDLSYFDHPPMVAWVEFLGLSLFGDPFSWLGLRLGFILLSAGSTVLMARVTERWYGRDAGFFAALALSLTGYYGLAAATFALPDGPLLFFWLLTLDRLSVALRYPGSLRPWLWVGLAWGGAMLSKYHGVFLPIGVLVYLVVSGGWRRWLLSPGPYLAFLIGILMFSPVLIWNSRHNWVSFCFQGGRALGSVTPRPDLLAGAVVAQAAYLFPWIWLPLVVRLARGLRDLHAGRERAEAGLGPCLAVVPLGLFLAVACFRPVLPHWGLIGLVSLFPVLGRDWSRAWGQNRRVGGGWLAAAAAFSLLLVALTLLQYHTGFLQKTGSSGRGLVELKTDPTAELYGWDQVAKRLDQLGVLDDPSVFLFTRHWFTSAQIAHAVRLRRPVLCYNPDDARGFAFWSRPEEWVGRDGILLVVNNDPAPVSFYRRWFRDAIPIGDDWVERRGQPIRRIQAYRMREQIAAFPLRPTVSRREFGAGLEVSSPESGPPSRRGSKPVAETVAPASIPR